MPGQQGADQVRGHALDQPIRGDDLEQLRDWGTCHTTCASIYIGISSHSYTTRSCHHSYVRPAASLTVRTASSEHTHPHRRPSSPCPSSPCTCWHPSPPSVRQLGPQTSRRRTSNSSTTVLLMMARGGVHASSAGGAAAPAHRMVTHACARGPDYTIRQRVISG